MSLRALRDEPLRHEGQVTALALSRDGARLASSGREGKVRIWDVASGTEQASFKGGSKKDGCVLAWSSDGRWLAAGTRSLSLHDATMGFAKKKRTSLKLGAVASCVAFHPNGELVAVGIRDNLMLEKPRLFVFDLDGEVVFERTFGASVVDLAWSADGARLAVSGMSYRNGDRGRVLQMPELHVLDGAGELVVNTLRLHTTEKHFAGARSCEWCGPRVVVAHWSGVLLLDGENLSIVAHREGVAGPTRVVDGQPYALAHRPHREGGEVRTLVSFELPTMQLVELGEVPLIGSVTSALLDGSGSTFACATGFNHNIRLVTTGP